ISTVLMTLSFGKFIRTSTMRLSWACTNKGKSLWRSTCSLFLLMFSCTAHRMRGMLVSAGYEPKVVEISTTVDFFKNEESHKQFVAQWLDYRQRIPQHGRDEFMEEFIATYRDLVKDVIFSDGSRYLSERDEGVRVEGVHVRILARSKPNL